MKYSDFSSRIAWALNQIPETIAEMSKNLGINKNTVAVYKKGKGDVKGSVIVALHKVYSYDPYWMITGQGDPKVNQKVRLSEVDTIERDYTVEESKGEYAEKNKGARKRKNFKTIDNDLFLDIYEKVDLMVAENIDEISSENKGRATILLYNYFSKSGEAVDEKTVLEFLKLAETHR